MKTTLPLAGLLSLLASGCGPTAKPPPEGIPSAAPFVAVAEYRAATWSPDGKELIFFGGPRHEFRLYRIPAAGGEPIAIFKEAHQSKPATSATAQRMAFTMMRPPGYWHIWTANVDGSSLKQVTQGRPPSDFYPAWSPDGHQIAYVSPRPYPYARIVLVPADGGKKRTLTDGTSPTWAPDGKSIAFVRKSPAGIASVFIRTLDTDRERRLECTQQKDIIGDPLPTVELSPDG